MGKIEIPDPKTPEEIAEFELNNRMREKLDEYERIFNDDFTTEFLPMTKEEIIENIDKCIRNNRKWDGYIVPEIEEDDYEI